MGLVVEIEAQRVDRANRIAWAILAALLLVTFAWLPFSRIVLKPVSLGLPLAVTGAMILGGWYYGRRRGEPRLAAALDCTGQMTGFTALGALLSYLMATLGLPLQDGAFYAFDRNLGLDWFAYLKAVDARPWLGLMFSIAYISLIPQMIVLITALSFGRQAMRARITILAMMIAGVVTIIISGLVPAMAMFVHLGLGPADYPNLNPQASFVHVADMKALRAGASFPLDLDKAQGIITFPSYHAALGLLAIIGTFANRWVRWPFLLLNVTMIAATPIDGGHYFVDVAAGLAIAVGSYLAARSLVLRGATSPRPGEFTASPSDIVNAARG